MYNPNINRLIMFIILFTGLGVFAVGYSYFVYVPYVRWPLAVFGIILCIASLIWGIKKVRCPYCDRLLSLKIWYDVKCPYCKRKIDDF